MHRIYWAILSVLAILPGVHGADNIQHGLKLPPGFEITEYAGSDLANDIYTMTLDPKGRVVVAGRGYIRILIDKDRNGKAEDAILFADNPKDGAMGLYWEGDSLYCVGDGALRRFRDANQDGKADGPSEVIRRLRTGGEHHAHAIRRGPDQWLYVLCGNITGISASYAQGKTSPIQQPTAGTVIRLSPDLKTCEVVADGFRNPYGMDFNAQGDLFTYDSDNERCVSLPWYEHTRFYHVIPGSHYGWRSPQYTATWRFPPHFLDVVPPLVTCERGSPTGVVCYRHRQFPPKYRNGFFLLDWTFGIIYFVNPKPFGSSYQGQRETFLQAIGDNGFAPTGAAIHPQTGDLYVSIGGRGTRGAVYRIRYTKATGINPGLTPIQSRSLQWNPDLRKKLPDLATSEDLHQRLQALTLIRRHQKQFTPAERIRIIQHNWSEADRFLCQATARLILTLPDKDIHGLKRQAKSPFAKTTYALAIAQKEPQAALSMALSLLDNQNRTVRLNGARLVQIALGGVVSPKTKGSVWEGYSPRKSVDEATREKVTEVLLSLFPTKDDLLNKEIARALAMVEPNSPSALQKVARHWTEKSHPSDDLHYLIAFSRINGSRSRDLTQKVATALLAIDKKIVQRNMNRDRHWPARLRELHRELVRKDPILNSALISHADFGRADHVVWAQQRGIDSKKAAERFLATAKMEKDFTWSPELIQIIGRLPAQRSLPILRELWDNAGLNGTILPILARNPQSTDRPRFLQSLTVANINQVQTALRAIQKLPERREAKTLLALVQSLRSLPTGKQEDRLRKQISDYLTRLTGQKHANREQWAQWLKAQHPELADRLNEGNAIDTEAWKRRLAGINWGNGNAGHGFEIYKKTSCIACHSGARALGPDLSGVTERFSRHDLFTAIIDPSRDVSSRYKTVSIETEQGKFYQGVIIYQAVDSVLIQTGATETARLDFKQIAERRTLAQSLMPLGLLDKLKDEEIADLYAYLKSLGKKP